MSPLVSQVSDHQTYIDKLEAMGCVGGLDRCAPADFQVSGALCKREEVEYFNQHSRMNDFNL